MIMNGENQIGERRKISVGFIEPRPVDFDDDTIYVQEVRSPTGIDSVQATSRKIFKYSDEEGVKEGQRTEMVCGSLGLDYFLTMLEEKNNIGAVEERYREDGLKLDRTLREIHEKSDPNWSR